MMISGMNTSAFIFLLIYFLHHFPPKVSTRQEEQCTKDTCSTQSIKTILFWTPFYNKRNYSFGFGQKPFIDAKCRYSNCQTTFDRMYEGQADAILFHMRNMDIYKELPLLRKNNQRYAFFLMENPYNQWNQLRNWEGYFNLTMTYRHDSDVKLLYGKYEKSQQISEPKQQISKVTTGKKGKGTFVAWFASNCNTHSKREQYVTELQKHIKVDIFGKCGHLQCPTRGENIIEKHLEKECYKMLEENYKFYLSFENIHCEDYVTEKLFIPLDRDVIPVVMGGTNYTRDAPPNSVINIADFTSPRQLAEHLNYLNNNPEEYKKHHEWKKEYKIYLQDETITQAFCDLCELLQDDKYPVNTYNNLDQWWGKETKCDRDVIRNMKKHWT